MLSNQTGGTGEHLVEVCVCVRVCVCVWGLLSHCSNSQHSSVNKGVFICVFLRSNQRRPHRPQSFQNHQSSSLQQLKSLKSRLCHCPSIKHKRSRLSRARLRYISAGGRQAVLSCALGLPCVARSVTPDRGVDAALRAQLERLRAHLASTLRAQCSSADASVNSLRLLTPLCRCLSRRRLLVSRA